MGDSAGGGFALALAQELSTGPLRLPQRLILLSPWLDLGMTNPDIALMEATDPLLSVEALRMSGKRWSGETQSTDWHLSPLFGPIDNLPPVILFTGTADVLNPDAKKFRDRFAGRENAIDYREYPGMMHVWMLFGFPESLKARADIVCLIQ
jgi:acetyl esterase/lipase